MEADSPLARVIGAFVEHSLKQELDEHLGYEPHERVEPSEELPETRRGNTRNGYGSKTLKTSVGTSTISVPRDRDGSFTPKLLPKHGTVTGEVAERVVAMYAGGMTTRDIAEHIRALYHFEASEDFVSELVARVEPELRAWRNRGLEAIYAIVYVDALHLKIRHSNGVRATACYIVSGYSEIGNHEVLGIWIAPSEHSINHGESASFWHTVLNELGSRGVQDVLFVASDALSGLEQAIAAVFPTAAHIPCVVHQMRRALSQVGYSNRKIVARELKPIYQAPTFEAAELALEQFQQKYAVRYPSIARQWHELLPRLAVLWTFSPALRKMIYTTNPLENINRQIRKVTKNRGVMPSIDSALRLLTLVLRQIDQRAKERTRSDWHAILLELNLRFEGRLPADWGSRFC
jgi:transposase-like protein